MKRLFEEYGAVIVIVLATALSITIISSIHLDLGASFSSKLGDYRVEVVRGYGRKVGSEKATLVFGDKATDTGYSYYGYFEGGEVDQSGANSTKRYTQACSVAGARVNGMTVIYGNKNLYVDMTGDSTTYGVFISDSGNLNLTSTGTQLLQASPKQSGANNLYLRFTYIKDDLTIILHYANETGTLASEISTGVYPNICFNNIAGLFYKGNILTNSRVYSLENDTVLMWIPGKSASSTYATHPAFVTKPLKNRTVSSITVVYAGKYTANITSSMLTGNYYFTKDEHALTPTAGDSPSASSTRPLQYNNGTFTFYEVSGIWNITYNYGD